MYDFKTSNCNDGNIHEHGDTESRCNFADLNKISKNTYMKCFTGEAQPL